MNRKEKKRISRGLRLVRIAVKRWRDAHNRWADQTMMLVFAGKAVRRRRLARWGSGCTAAEVLQID